MRKDQFDPFETVMEPVYVAGLGSSVAKIIAHYSAESFNIDGTDIMGKSVIRQIALARQVSYYIAKCTTKWTTTEIGRRFGMRDHTTIMHGIRKIDRLYQDNREFRTCIDDIRRNVVLVTTGRSPLTVPAVRKQYVPEQPGAREGADTDAGSKSLEDGMRLDHQVAEAAAV